MTLRNDITTRLEAAVAEAQKQGVLPEGELPLAHAAIYVATAPKSNSVNEARGAAKQAVKDQGPLPVPLHLRNAPTKLMEELDYGKDYQYAHDHEGNFSDQEFLPDDLSGSTFYEPSDNNRENDMRARLRVLWGSKYGY